MSVPVFSFQLKYDILPGLVTIGKYDGSHSCLTAATTGAKILIHSPHRHQREISFLNVNETVNAICAGKLNPDEDKDILVIGSASSVLVYHVDNNSELFFKEVVPDGVTAVTIGNLGNYPTPLLIVGGNCSIQGFDWKGQEVYWTVTGDNVTSLALVDINQDGQNELLVGSDDFEIRVFKEDSIIHQMTESESVISLVPFKDNRFAYALANGTVGMYEKFSRVWRVKARSKIQCLGSYDLDGNGTDELITGWSNAKIDARNSHNSIIIFKDVLGHGIAGIVAGDYKRVGRNQLIVVSQAGEVRGYDSTSITQDAKAQTDVQLLKELFLRKQSMLSELKNYNVACSTSPGIPANTLLNAEINSCMANAHFPENHILISLSTNNFLYIRAASVLAEGIFEGEALVTHPRLDHVTSTLDIALIPPKDAVSDINIRVLCSSETNCDQFHVFEAQRPLPRFSMYLLIPYNAPAEPSSYVSFPMSERVQRLDLWIRQNFIAPKVIPRNTSTNLEWSIGIKSLRDGSAVNIKYTSGLMTLVTENMGLACEIIQSLANYLNINKLESQAEFPKVFEEMEMMLSQIKNLQQNASKMSATIADNAGLVRSLVVQAEDARIIAHVQDFRECYSQLQQINDEMLRNHTLYCNNHEELMKILKKINLIIQHASRMRVDKNGSDFVSQCRRAVADYNWNVLTKLIRTGST